MKYLLLFVAVFLFNFAYAQYTDKNIWQDQEDGKLDYRDIENEQDILLRDESIIYNDNQEIGTKEQRYYTGLDKHLVSFQYHTSSRIHHLQQFSSFEVLYAYKFSNWWLELMGDYTLAKFEDVSENKTDQGPSNGGKPDDLNEQIMRIGVGLGHRFKFHTAWKIFEKVFNTVAFYATYNTVVEELSSVDSSVYTGISSYKDQTYTGYGIRVDYGLHHRSANSFFYGMRLTYNSSWVEREKIDTTETDDDAYLSLSWMTIGVETGWYF